MSSSMGQSNWCTKLVTCRSTSLLLPRRLVPSLSLPVLGCSSVQLAVSGNGDSIAVTVRLWANSNALPRCAYENRKGCLGSVAWRLPRMALHGPVRNWECPASIRALRLEASEIERGQEARVVEAFGSVNGVVFVRDHRRARGN